MRTYTLIATGALALGSIVAVGGVAQAGPAETTEETAAPAPASTSTFTLPGVPLVVSLTTDVGGGLLDVSLDPTDGYDADKVWPKRVSFVNEEAGTSVRIKAKHGGERVEARAGTLADILGPGGWSGDLFGTGEDTTVAFTIATAASGGPDITGVAVGPVATDVEFTVGETKHDSDEDDGEIEHSASVAIAFEYLGQTRTMKIKANVETEGDDTSAKIKVSLSRLKGRQLAQAGADGAYGWSGQLCSGETATIAYTVSADGRIEVTSTSPEADVSANGHQAKVSFSRHERVSIKASDADIELEVGVSEKFRCDRVVPTINGDEVPATDDERNGHKNNAKDDKDERKDDKDERKDDKDERKDERKDQPKDDKDEPKDDKDERQGGDDKKKDRSDRGGDDD